MIVIMMMIIDIKTLTYSILHSILYWNIIIIIIEFFFSLKWIVFASVNRLRWSDLAVLTFFPRFYSNVIDDDRFVIALAAISMNVQYILRDSLCGSGGQSLLNDLLSILRVWARDGRVIERMKNGNEMKKKEKKKRNVKK